MTILIKAFVTYSVLSMVGGLFYGFVYGSIVGISKTNSAIFMLLWGGPLMLTVSIGGPIALYHMWMNHD